jgi:hypothetical protein
VPDAVRPACGLPPHRFAPPSWRALDGSVRAADWCGYGALGVAEPFCGNPADHPAHRLVEHAHGQHGMHVHSPGEYAEHQRPIEGERFGSGGGR